MENHLSVLPYMFGNRPSSSDFGLYGQLTQLVGFDPTPSNIAYKNAPRTVSWVSTMSDLSGLHDKGGIGMFFGIDNNDEDKNLNYFNDNTHGWIYAEDIPNTLKDIFKEIGKVYIPCLIANSKAYNNGDDIWETNIDNATWRQKTFPYQAKCLNWIKEEFNKLSSSDKDKVINLLEDTGCNEILN
jgi:hypothetical protein